MPDQVAAPIEEARRLYRDVRQFPRILKAPNLSPIVAGQDSTVDLATKGYEYRAILFEAFVGANRASEAVMKNDITKIQAIVDGDTKVDLTGGATELAAIDRYYNTRAGVNPIGNGVLPLQFVRPWHREIAGEDGPAWGMDDCRNFQLILGFNGGGITITKVNLWMIVSDPKPLGRHLCIRRFPRAFAATGVDRESKWKNDTGTQLMAIHTQQAPDTNLTSVKLTVDKVIEMEDMNVLLWHQYQQLYERTPQSGWSHLEFATRGRLKDGIPMIAGEMNLDLTWTVAPNAHTLLLETIEGPSQ